MVARKIAYNVVFNTISKFLSIGLALVGIGFITRYLGKSGFGNYATVLAFFAFFSAIADLGLYPIATREISREEADPEEIIGNVFTLRVAISLMIFFVSPLLAYVMPYSYEVKMGIVLSALAFVFSSSYSVLNGVFQKHLAMDKVATAELIGKAVQVGVIIVSVKKDLGFTAIVMAMVAAMVVNFGIVFLWSRKYIKFSLRFDFKYWKKFAKVSLPMGISAIITFLYFKMDTILLSFMKGSEEVGIYNAGYKIIETITFFPAMIVGLILPLVSLYIFKDKKKLNKILDQTFKIFTLLIIPIVIGVMFLAEDIINVINGSGFEQSANVLRILIFALLFIFFGNFFNNILLAGNLQKKMMKVLFFCAVFNIVANIIFIPKYSYISSAIISVVTESLVVLSTAYIASKYLKYTPKFEGIMKVVFSGSAMALYLFMFAELNFFVLVASAATVYFTFLFLTNAIKKEEIMLLLKKPKA